MHADNAVAEARTPDKLSIVVFSGAYDRVHYALAMAAAALAANQAVDLLFTMGAVRALEAAGGPWSGWQGLLPTEDGSSPLTADQALTGRGLVGFEELLAAVVALGGAVMVCEMGLKAIGLDAACLRSDVPVTEGGLFTFLTAASPQGNLVFV